MELNIETRVGKKKSEVKKLRREGKIPAVLYSQGKVGETIVVEANAIKKVLQKIVPGTLSTTIFTLGNGKSKKQAIIKDIQYNITTYDVIHLDFVELLDKVPVELNVPIQFTGAMECIGVKQGGGLRQVIRTLKVRCLPKYIPTHFVVDVKDLGLGESKKLMDIALPDQVIPVSNLNEIVAVVAKQ